ncbi:MAG: hypothetical protein ACYC96_01745 [Fimbriimonadaceae bacterium]
MNPPTVVICLFALTMVAQGQTPKAPTKLSKASYHYRMLHAGVQIGDASYDRMSSATDRRTLLTINETVEGVTLNAVFDSLTKNDGTPEKKAFHGLLGQHPFSSTAVFDAAGVEFTIQDVRGQTQKATIKRPPGCVLADASETWFDGVVPKKGDSVTFTNFDIQNGKWEVTTTTYVGDEETKVGTKSITTHHLHVKSDGGEIDMYLDGSADIVVMDQAGSLRLERAD